VIQTLIDNPLLLLFVVLAIGYPLGRIRVAGSSLGVAAVLFVGLALGSLHPDLKLPEIIYTLGLVIFVYSLGLSSGPGFFASFRRKGLRDNLFVVGMIVFATLAVGAAQVALHLKPALAAGVFAGSLTNTPALAAILESIKTYAAADRETLLAQPVVGYSITYPVGVLGMMLCIFLVQRLWKVDYAGEASQQIDLGTTSQQLLSTTIHVMRTEATVDTAETLVRRYGGDVAFGRMRRAGRTSIVTPTTAFAVGDLVTAIGTQASLAELTAFLGETSDEQIDLDRSEFDYRRMFVSNPKIVGHRLRDLDLPQQFGAVVTRVRRGDVELLAHEDTMLELGDRVRVVTKRENLEAVSAFFGDSYRALSEIDILTFSLGLALGSLLGMIPVPLPGGSIFRLGLAGGPLIVALVLGKLGRTGPMVWNLPYSANITLRQIGLILFLAGIGTRAGYSFATTFTQEGGLLLLAVGAGVTCGTGFLALWVGHRLLRIPMSVLIGMLAGMQTQPAVLGFAVEQTHNDLPNVGYANVYPVATITKILCAQALLAFLR